MESKNKAKGKGKERENVGSAREDHQVVQVVENDGLRKIEVVIRIQLYLNIFEAENAHSKDSRYAYLDDNENSGDTDRSEEATCNGKTKRGETKTKQGKRFREVVKE